MDMSFICSYKSLIFVLYSLVTVHIYVSAAEIHNFQNSEMTGEASTMESTQNEASLLSTLPKELPLEFFIQITSGFSKERIIRGSAFGTFYKVRLLVNIIRVVQKMC